MYPNNTKAFLNLKNVFVKNVIQADSFLKIFIKTKPSEQTYPCYGCKTKRVFLPSYHRRTRRLAFCVIYFLRQTFFLKQVSILTWVSVLQSADFWIPSIIRPQISFPRLPLLGNISVSSLILKNTEFWIFFQTTLRAIWLITGETLRERKGLK